MSSLLLRIVNFYDEVGLRSLQLLELQNNYLQLNYLMEGMA